MLALLQLPVDVDSQRYHLMTYVAGFLTPMWESWAESMSGFMPVVGIWEVSKYMGSPHHSRSFSDFKIIIFFLNHAPEYYMTSSNFYQILSPLFPLTLHFWTYFPSNC